MRRQSCSSALAIAALVFFDAAAEAATTSIGAVIKSEGQFAFTDGSSLFRLEKGGAFHLDPVGVSGRTIRSVWRTGDYRKFTVTGKWGWLNGISRDDDYRRPRLHISYHPGLPGPPKLHLHKVKVYSVYFTVEELTLLCRRLNTTRAHERIRGRGRG